MGPGETAEHIEEWRLFDGVSLEDDDEAIESVIAPLIAGFPECEV